NAFFWCGGALRSVMADCIAASVTVVNGQPMVGMARDLDDRARQKALSVLTSGEEEFRKIGMTINSETGNDLIKELKRESRHSFHWLHTKAVNIESLAQKELRDRLFLYVPPERAKFWPTNSHPHAFGDEVAKNFPSATFDISNGAVCLATMMSTASVFH